MSPSQSYRIWFSQRNGSTLLCKGLEQTGIAGSPGEYFNVMDSETLCEKYHVDSYTELKKAIWSQGTSSNGVFGIKHSMHTARFNQIYDELRSLRNIPDGSQVSEEELLGDFFPNCKHIYLTRRNKIRQAVSWWKAIQDNVWHLENQEAQDSIANFYEERYDFDAISHLFMEATLRECAIQAYFSKYQIRPMTLVYEDFADHFEQSITNIIEFLEIEYDQINIQPKFYQKTANEQSEVWVQRFRNDLQKKMGADIW